MVPVWTDDPEAALGELSFGPSGAVIVPHDEGEELVRIPWRTIAPYVRADGPLGPALAAQGLTLAPIGTTAPPVPNRTVALLSHDAGAAIGIAARLPAAVRAGTRLRIGADESLVLLPPGADLSQYPGVVAGARRTERHLYGALAEVVSVRLGEAIELHESAGPRTPVVGALPAGAVTVAARGPIGSRTSEPGTGWVLIAGARGTGGYAQGRSVALLEGCGAPASSGEGPPAEPIAPLPVVFHVAADEAGVAVAAGRDLAQSLRDANDHFAAAGLGFRRVQTLLLPPGTALLRTVRERRALRRELVRQAINVFVFGAILDPHPSEATRRAAARIGRAPTGRLAGGHIPAPGHRPPTYIILSRQSGPLALAHELGHFLGAPHHRDPENIMSYGPERHRFDAWQLTTFRRRAKTALRRRWLRGFSTLRSNRQGRQGRQG
jgi:hypothetical protein